MKKEEIKFVLNLMQEEINLRKEYSTDEFVFIFHADYVNEELMPSEFSFDLYKIKYLEEGVLIWEVLDDNVTDKDLEPAWNLTFYYLEYNMIKGITNVF